MTPADPDASPDPFGPEDEPSRRRDARERTVEVLYEAEMKGVTAASVLDEMILTPDPLVSELVVGVEDHQTELDEQIANALDRSWTLARLSVLDRLIMRMATYELIHRPGVPVAVALNEAVELAKLWSGPEAGRFVNGVLSGVARSVRG
ncbi:MAG: transcription antitermination factor NusB [Acidimicrobiales bacterium]|nr:transcription antitermination factor NusB [Acidimicrobiales bacterium]